jgi:ketosteroid isomerase-like protein
MKKILVCAIVSIIVSCQQRSTAPAVVKAPVDSLITNWSNSWNDHDSASVRNLFMADALLLDNNLIANNTDEIAAKWIYPNINLVHNFKSTGLQDWSTNDRAGYTGKYEFDVIVNDSILAHPKGAYTVNWIKTDNGEWKITTAAIHSLTE